MLRTVQEIEKPKDLICTTHEHELRGQIARENGGTGQMGAKGEKLGQL